MEGERMARERMKGPEDAEDMAHAGCMDGAERVSCEAPERAVVLLGHGSRSPEATEQFLEVARMLAPRLPGARVYPAFMELAEPAFADAVARAVATGARRVEVLPCFLFAGNHIKSDVPGDLAKVAEQHPGIEFAMRGPIGPDPRLCDILLERLGVGSEPVWGALGPDEIEAKSMRTIDAALPGLTGPAEWAVARRIIHASGDLSLGGAISFSPGGIEVGTASLIARAPVICDVRMVQAGIDKRRLGALGGTTRCLIDNDDVAAEAVGTGQTRSAVAIRRLASEIDGAVVAIGNAPSALREVLALAREGTARPALVVGMPVGFVDAAESKEALIASGLAFLAVRGARGGSPLAAAAVNALLRLALGE